MCDPFAVALLFPGVRFGLTSRGVFAVGNQSCLGKSGTLVSDVYIQSFILKSVLNEAEVGWCCGEVSRIALQGL